MITPRTRPRTRAAASARAADSPYPSPAAVTATTLSLVRIVMAGIFPRFGRTGQVVLVVLAGLSDLLDGVIARQLNGSSTIGGLADAIGDKAFAFSVLLDRVRHGAIGRGQALLLLARDIMVGAMLVAAGFGWLKADIRKVRPGPMGKLTTAGLFALLLSLLVRPRGRHPLQRFLLAATAASSVAAAVTYLVRYLREEDA